MDIKRTFEKGVMNKDLDERLVPNGYYRHAENIITDSTEGSDVGVIKNILSNKQVTNLELGNNVRTLHGFSDETKQKIYYFVLSETGAFLIEYDDKTQSASFVLKDTRVNKVLDLKDDFRITSIQKIYNDDDKNDLLLWTNNDMEICCINIERAKSYSVNGFEKEDIYLIKKPPVNKPEISFIQNHSEANEIEEKFILFAYRYKYLDGEYSALSPFTLYNFIPKPFEVDFETLHNKAMVNNFNAVNVFYNTGDHRVTDVQIVAKFSNSETMYIVETFNKEKEGLGNNTTASIIYNNKKLYAALPEKELYRTYDNVPRKAKALTLIGNRVVLGNYTEGYDIKDAYENKIKLSYGIDIVSKDVNQEKKYNGIIKSIGYMQSSFQIKSSNSSTSVKDFLSGNTIPIGPATPISGTLGLSPIPSTSAIEFPAGSSIEFNIYLIDDNSLVVYQKLYSIILNSDITDYNLAASNEFNTFIGQINEDIKNNFTDASLPNNIDILSYPNITLESGTNFVNFILNPLLYNDNDNQVSVMVPYHFGTATTFKNVSVGIPTSLKAYTDYEVGIIYQDEYKRGSTVLTSIENTKFIPFVNTYTQNKLKISINHKPPYWAKYYRFAIKTKPLEYENIYVNRFYEENGFTWAKLEGDNKDKVKKNDELLVKKTANNNITKPIKIKVLDIVDQPSDFIKGNKDIAGMDIIEEAGLYMKIKPTEFSMNLNDYDVRQAKETAKVSGTGNFPSTYASLFSTTENNTTKLFGIPTGSIIQLYIKSSNHPDDGWQDNILNKTFYVSENFNSLGEWFNQNIVNVNNLYGNEGNAQDNYYGKISVVRGELSTIGVGTTVFVPNPSGREFLRVTGTKPGMTGDRYGYLDVSINVRTSDGFYVFETMPKKEVDLDIYYMDSETFEIENGFHKGKDQNQTSTTAAVSTLDFFNCYTFGNGVESYKVRDGFNENYLNIDYAPCTTTVEEFKETVRLSDITWGSVYNESSNINGLNEFNTANLNWIELDKQNGEIRLLHSREGNLLVIQEDKWGQVLFGKNAIYSADGNPTLTTTNDVFRDYIPYAGTYGITDIESFVTEANRCYAVDKKRGAVLRLSIDGITTITQGMNHWFKTTFQDRNQAKVIGGYDPFYKTYNITIDEQPEIINELQCGQSINKFNFNEPFKYILKTNGLSGPIFFDYNIPTGSVDIRITDWNTSFYNNLYGQGQIEFENGFTATTLTVEIVPVSSSASIEITNICPLGNPMKLRTLVLNSMNDAGLVFSHGFSKNNGITYRTDVQISDNGMVSQNEILNGQEGIGKLPTSGDTVKIKVFDDATTTKQFDASVGNKVKYLVTAQNFTLFDLPAIISQATTIPLDSNLSGEFVFNRNNINENLVIIYDLRGYEPLDIATSATLNYSSSLIYFNTLFTVDYPIQAVTITQYPTNGNVLVSALNSFVVSYSGSSPTNDTMYLEYDITIQGITFHKSLTINVNLLD